MDQPTLAAEIRAATHTSTLTSEDTVKRETDEAAVITAVPEPSAAAEEAAPARGDVAACERSDHIATPKADVEDIARRVVAEERARIAGIYNLLPFEILPNGDGQYVVDTYHISYVSTGRDLLRFKEPAAGRGTQPMVVANPDFNYAAPATTPPVAPAPGRRSRALEKFTPYFPPLPGSEEEGNLIGSMLGVRPLMGQDVLERRLKECRSPSILHIATHGFFLTQIKVGMSCGR